MKTFTASNPTQAKLIVAAVATHGYPCKVFRHPNDCTVMYTADKVTAIIETFINKMGES